MADTGNRASREMRLVHQMRRERMARAMAAVEREMRAEAAAVQLHD